jgi:HK97 family phage major capsid protein
MNELEKLSLEMRNLKTSIDNGSITAKDAKVKMAELRNKKTELEQKQTLAEKPADERTSKFEDVAKAMREKRAITLNGTGAINVVKELIVELQKKTPVLDGVRYFYGANAATNIPVLSPTIAVPGAQAEGATAVANDATAVLGAAAITPRAYVSVLPVSAETINLGAINFESELPTVFADAFAQAWHNGILTGNGTGLQMNGLFASVPAANQVTELPTFEGLHNLALKVQDYIDDGVIIINPAYYAAIFSNAADPVKAAWLMNREIEGVKIIITSAAPSGVATGGVFAVAGSLSRYALGIASELLIDPIKKVGDTNTYFQATMFANGKPINAKDFWALKMAAPPED